MPSYSAPAAPRLLQYRKPTVFPVALIGLFLAIGAAAQPDPEEPWLGVQLPAGFEPHESPFIVGDDYGPRPARVPEGEEGFENLEGESIRQDLETIVDFAVQSREREEVGEGQLWGRITGLPAAERTMDWAEEQFEEAGVSRVERQWFDQEPDAALWLPLSWEVRLLGDPALGEGSRDVVLESAMPTGGSQIPEEGLTAPLVFVGTARPAELAHIDVRGKVAVQHVVPKGHLFLERGPTRARARDLMDRGAVAVFNVIEQPGNMRMRDISGCGGPCFNIGGQDGRFLEELMDRAAQADRMDELEVRMELEAEERSGMRASNVLGIVEGESEENIIINAHADSWFDGANDNGDGLAVMLALARHFARLEHQPQRTLVFVASAGHHTPGLRGPSELVEMNPELIERNVLTINLEHVAARQFNPARSVEDGGFRNLIADSGEGYLMNGVTNRSPFLEDLIRQGGDRYGLNFVSEASDYAAGDNPPVDSPLFQLIQANPLYHSSGETLETVSTPGMERVARFTAFFVKEAASASREMLEGEAHPGRAVYETRCAGCHDGSNPRAASLESLRSMTRETLSYTLSAGIMSVQGQRLSDQQRTDVVEYLAADELSDEWIAENRCAAGRRDVNTDGPLVPTAGVDRRFSRHLTPEQGGLSTADMGNLELAWALGLPGVSGLRSAPAIAGDTLFYPAGVTGQVLAIDAASGCIRWAHDAGAPLRSSATLAEPLEDGRRPLIVTDEYARVHAIDAFSGEGIWTVDGKMDADAATRLTGAPLAYRDRVIIPVSASGSSRGADPDYECCEGRGAVLALDAATGERIWSWATLPRAEYTGEVSPAGVPLRGPSGAPVWSSPTLDETRGHLYITTGENSSLPASETSNAIIALDLETGEPDWIFQAVADDAWNMACTGSEYGPNCPSADESIRADWDFGSAAVPVSLADGRDLLLAGQKSGHLWALDPDDGSVVWQQRVGNGGPMGGNHWGVAVDGRQVYLTINDPHYNSMSADEIQAGVYAFDLASGEPVWEHRASPDCDDGRAERVARCEQRYGFSAMPLAVDGTVVAGNVDGRLFVFDSDSGETLFRFDTAREFETVNGVEAHGGSIDSHSVAAGAGMLFVGSGYARFSQTTGNVLLGFRPAP